jgi:hypothetical protein
MSAESGPHPDVIHWPSVFPREQCGRWVAGIYAGRPEWTPCFGGSQFTLGSAFYTHLEEARVDRYFDGAQASDERVERLAPGLQAALLDVAATLVSGPVERRPGWCGPGVHIFPAGRWVSQRGGDIHFDTEGLDEADRAARAPAFTLVVMLQPPHRGGGLRIWDLRYQGVDEVTQPADLPGITLDYGAGDLIAIDSYRLHQIQPFSGRRDRISATLHLVRRPSGWQAWF